MRRRQHFGEASCALAGAPPLVLQLGESLFELRGHPVERIGHAGELVAAARLHPLLQATPRDRIGRPDEAIERTDDRETEQVGQPAEREHGRQQADHDPPARGRDRGIELLARCERGELDSRTRAAAPQFRGREEPSVLGAAEFDWPGVSGRECDQLAGVGAGDDPAVLDGEEQVPRVERQADPLQHGVEHHRLSTALGGVDLLVVRGGGEPDVRAQAAVDPVLFAPLGERVEAVEGHAGRNDREQRKVGDELDSEASHQRKRHRSRAPNLLLHFIFRPSEPTT